MLKRIVQFPNGQYSYRKWTVFGYRYLDLNAIREVWWSKQDRYFKDCLTNDLDLILQEISYGDPI